MPGTPTGPASPNLKYDKRRKFSKQMNRVVFSILLFLFVYLFLLTAAGAFAAACVFAAAAILMIMQNWLTAIAAIGLVLLGVMVLWFLLKFLFKKSKPDTSNYILVDEYSQPKLLALVHEIAADTGAPKPAAVFLSAEMNASVFYTSSFLSLFFPVKKNLHIGLSLLHVLNASEFSAVLAHEFGHFSQKSMKAGSYVYQANRIIFDILYNNEGYEKTLNKLNRLHIVIGGIAGLSANIAQGIQRVLQVVYRIMNKNYMALSRQMEFDADTVAAQHAGSDNMISALRRLEFGDACYNYLIGIYNTWIPQHRKSKNLFEDLNTVQQELAVLNNITIDEQGLPFVTGDFLESSVVSRVVFADQWASHPAMNEREKHLSLLGIEKTADAKSAWYFIENREELQMAITEKVYQDVVWDGDIQTTKKEDIKRYIDEVKQSSKQPEIYQGYYASRVLSKFDTSLQACSSLSIVNPLEQVFVPSSLALLEKWRVLEKEMDTLQAIADKQIDTRSFDFDGRKYNARQATEIIEQLKTEAGQIKDQIDLMDRQVLCFLCHQLPAQASELTAAYEKHFSLRDLIEEFQEIRSTINLRLQRLFVGETINIPDAEMMILYLKRNEEPAFKAYLPKLLNMEPNAAVRNAIEEFLEKDYAYFSVDSFLDNELLHLVNLSNELDEFLQATYADQFKALLEQQANLLHQFNEDTHKRKHDEAPVN